MKRRTKIFTKTISVFLTAALLLMALHIESLAATGNIVSVPINFMAVARDRNLSVSWTNPKDCAVLKEELYDEYGNLVASSVDGTLSVQAGKSNFVKVSNLVNGAVYRYSLKIEYADGGEGAYECMSNVPNDMYTMLWGAPKGPQSFYGWQESVTQFPCVKFEVQTDVVHEGNAALMVRSNIAETNSQMFEQLGPELTSPMETGKTYRFSYWRKNVNAGSYCVFYRSSANAANYLDTESNSDWEQITMPDFVCDRTSGDADKNSNAPAVRFKFDKSAEAIYIDDVSLCEVRADGTLGENLLKNSGFETLWGELIKYADEVKTLLDECMECGISTDYETSAYMVLKYFANYLANDAINHVDPKQLEYNRSEYMEIYAEAKESLEEKLAGKKVSYTVPRYVTSPITISGPSFLAAVEENGARKENTPVFYTGFVGFNTPKSAIADFAQFGFNMVQTEIGPDSLVVKAENEKGYAINTDTQDVKILLNTLKQAAKYNIAVNVLVSPHYMPDFLYEKYPDMKLSQGGFIGYDVTNKDARAVLTDYLNAIIPLIKDEPALHSICLTNEPAFHSVAVKNNPALAEQWTEYLKEQYETIGALNSVYSAEYRTFEEIEMPVNPENALRPLDDGSPIFNDYINFNNRVFGEFHRFLAQTIKELAPNIPLHAKVQNTIWVTDDASPGQGREMIYRGYTYEDFSKFLDINGNDAYVHTGNGTREVEKLFLYDLQRSLKDVPVYNSEEHMLLSNQSKVFNDRVGKRMYSDLWEGAIHGRSASTMWAWERSYNTQSDFYNSMLHRPKAILNAGKACLDLNRLAAEVTQFQNKKADVAILYSDMSRNMDRMVLEPEVDAYHAATLAGYKVQFITDDTISNLHDYPVLIVPHIVAVKDETVVEIAKYVQNGGKVYMLSDENFIYDEHKSTNFSEKRRAEMQSILDSPNVTTLSMTFNAAHTSATPSKSSIVTNIQRWLRNQMTNVSIRLVDANGNDVQSVGWQWVKSGNDWLISAVNYAVNYNDTEFPGTDKENIRILINGVERNNIVDLISGERFDSSFPLKATEPRLLRVTDEKFYVSDITYCKDGKIIPNLEGEDVTITARVCNAGENERNMVFGVALYKDGRFISMESEEFIIPSGTDKEMLLLQADFPIKESNYEYKMIIWDGLDLMQPILYN